MPTDAINIINDFMQKVSKLGLGTIGTITGRYYAMDRDSNYDRVKKAYDAICYNVGNTFSDYIRCLELHYKIISLMNLLIQVSLLKIVLFVIMMVLYLLIIDLKI